MAAELELVRPRDTDLLPHLRELLLHAAANLRLRMGCIAGGCGADFFEYRELGSRPGQHHKGARCLVPDP